MKDLLYANASKDLPHSEVEEKPMGHLQDYHEDVSNSIAEILAKRKKINNDTPVKGSMKDLLVADASKNVQHSEVKEKPMSHLYHEDVSNSIAEILAKRKKINSDVDSSYIQVWNTPAKGSMKGLLVADASKDVSHSEVKENHMGHLQDYHEDVNNSITKILAKGKKINNEVDSSDIHVWNTPAKGSMKDLLVTYASKDVPLSEVEEKPMSHLQDYNEDVKFDVEQPRSDLECGFYVDELIRILDFDLTDRSLGFYVEDLLKTLDRDLADGS